MGNLLKGIAYYKSLSIQRKYELLLVLAFCLFGFISYIITMTISGKSEVNSSAYKILERQNKKLEENNVGLIKSIADIGEKIAERNVRDSVSMVTVEKNMAINNDLNKQITIINNKYEKAISSINSDSDIIEYLRSERISSQE